MHEYEDEPGHPRRQESHCNVNDHRPDVYTGTLQKKEGGGSPIAALAPGTGALSIMTRLLGPSVHTWYAHGLQGEVEGCGGRWRGLVVG
jgi:hypothetical protein